MGIVFARSLFLTVVLFAASLLPAGGGLHASPPDPNPHAHFKQPAQCPNSHVYDGAKLDPGRFDTTSIDFCLKCHIAEERGRTHPLKVHPGGKIRDWLAVMEHAERLCLQDANTCRAERRDALVRLSALLSRYR